MSRQTLFFILFFCSFGLVACQAEENPPIAYCPDGLVQGCRLEGGIEVRFDHAPRAMEPFDLTISAPGAGRIGARFEMEGMDMGANRYRLVAGKGGHFSARVTLPVCVASRSDWRMELDIDGRRLLVPFKVER